MHSAVEPEAHQANEQFREAVMRSDTGALRSALHSALVDVTAPMPYMTLNLPAIFVAVLRKDANIVKELVRAGESLHRVFNHMTPIQYAINLQRPDSFAFVLDLIAHDSEFDRKKVLREVLIYREKEMFRSLRRVVLTLPSPSALALGDDLPDFYFFEWIWQQKLILLYVCRRKVFPWSRLPLSLLRDISQYV